MFLWQEYAKTKPTAIALRVELKQDKSGDETRFSIVEKCWSWQQLNQLIQQQADGWQQQYQIHQGQGIALIGRYQLALVLGYLVALQLGCRVLVINPTFPSEKIEQICEQSEIDFLIDCQNLSANLDAVEFIAQPVNKAINQFFAIDVSPLTLTLTSGSTGLPKAVVHTIENHLASARAITPLLRINAQSEWLLSLPLFHVSGQAILWRWLFNGAVLRCVGESIYQDLVKVSHASLVPTQLQQFLVMLDDKQIIKYRLSHILLGGAHIPAALTQRAMKYGIHCYSGYGMTEMASTVFAKQSDTSDGVGYLLPEREYQIVGDEVWVRGSTLALGYWQKQQPLKSLLNEQGWFATRDKGTIDPISGELFILGRLDNMFISGGENIQPEEIESIILKQPNVHQVVVLPISDDKFGQRPVALLDFTDGFSFDKVSHLESVLQQKLEKFKWPVAYYPLDKLMPNQSGIKLSRHLLTQQLTLFLKSEK